MEGRWQLKVKARILLLAACGLLSSTIAGQGSWALDTDFGQGGRSLVETGGWEWPVALERSTLGVRVWGQVYGADGQVSSHGWRMDGMGNWDSSVELASGGEVVDALGVGEISWVLSERSWSVLDSAGLPAIQTSVVVESWHGDTLRSEFGGGPGLVDGLVDMQFVGPVQTPTALAEFGGWLAIAGHGLDSCCAHTERPVLAVINAETGAFRADFGYAGRVALDMAAWALEDSVRHEASGVFYDVAFDVLPGGDTVLYACGGYQAQSYFQPLVVRVGISGPFAGALDTTFGVGGMATIDLNPLHNLNAVSLQTNSAAGPLHVLLRADGGGDFLEMLYVLQFDIDGQPVALLESGAPPPLPPALTSDEPVRSYQLLNFGAGELWGLGLAGDDLNFNGVRQPVAFQFTNDSGAAPSDLTWWADTAWASHSLGPALAEADTLWITGALYDRSSTWAADQTAVVLSKWVRSGVDAVPELTWPQIAGPSMCLPPPFPNPTDGRFSWDLPPGRVEMRTLTGRLLGRWAHRGGLFHQDAARWAQDASCGQLVLLYIGEEKSGFRSIILAGNSRRTE